jgi:DNA-binding NarL/FixJ family response regulator
MGSVRIAVISDERFFHDSFNRILTSVSALVVVPLDARLDAPQAILAAGLDVAVIDYRMKDALDLCRVIARASGPVVLVMQIPDDECVAAGALVAGARGIVHTSSPVDDAISAIVAVSKGQLWAASHVVDRWVRVQFASLAEARDTPAFDRALSSRELEVLRHAASGLANKEVAGRLSITEATVKVHLTHIFRKLGLRSRTELAAAYHGLRPFSATHEFSRRHDSIA